MTPAALHHLVEPSVPGCPASQMDTAIRLSASEFCARTKCWRETVTMVIPSTAHTGCVPLLPAHAIIHQIEAAWFDGCELEPAAFTTFSPAELDRIDGRPRYLTQRKDGQLRLVPRAAGTLIVNLLLKPPAGTDGPAGFTLPDFLVQQHAEALAAGALARLLVMPGKPWLDPGAAGIQAGIFKRAVGANMARNQYGQQRTPRRIRAHFF